MNVSQHEHAFTRPLDILQLANQVPAAFSDCAADTTSDNYVFISTRNSSTRCSTPGSSRPRHGKRKFAPEPMQPTRDTCCASSTHASR